MKNVKKIFVLMVLLLSVKSLCQDKNITNPVYRDRGMGEIPPNLGGQIVPMSSTYSRQSEVIEYKSESAYNPKTSLSPAEAKKQMENMPDPFNKPKNEIDLSWAKEKEPTWEGQEYKPDDYRVEQSSGEYVQKNKVAYVGVDNEERLRERDTDISIFLILILLLVLFLGFIGFKWYKFLLIKNKTNVLDENISSLEKLRKANIISEDQFIAKVELSRRDKIKTEFLLSEEYKALNKLKNQGFFTEGEFNMKIEEIITNRIQIKDFRLDM